MTASSQTAKSNPKRSEVPEGDTWDLASLFQTDASWLEVMAEFEKEIGGFAQFAGRLGESAEVLAQCLTFDVKLDRLGERLGTYAFLKTTEDQGNSHYQGFVARYQNLATKAGQAASFIRPEILSIPAERMAAMMTEECLKPYALVLERINRYRKHTLSQPEENLLAMQGEMAQTASKAFRQLNDADLKFGELVNENGDSIELTNASFSSFLLSPDRDVRKRAFHQYYKQFQAHENTLSATLAGSIHGDVYYAKARNYQSARESSLFADNVPLNVYDNLITAVRNRLPEVHSYFDMRRRKMGLADIHHYDTYVPVLAAQQSHHTWDEAVSVVLKSLEPLGPEYGRALEKGLRGRWSDRYPNQGKQSGAFSCGTYDADPFILMNFKPSVLNDVFTLTHEAGHSMHSFYSAANQPFQYYNYTIFVAEVASTFNEQLLAHYMVKNAKTKEEKAAILNHEIDSIRATIVRQTMFAEFEKITHDMAENGEPLTVASFKAIYAELLRAYFGPEFVIDEELSLECFRIPHFYRAFYVYKYATGLSAAIALSKRVLEGGKEELDAYLSFLKGGCSKDPLDLLKGAGVDMTKPEPVEVALIQFGDLVKQLDELV
ncbi:MAG: oligoendopeptidase F [Planctomycetota bacterium]|nr:oligoendopeptidase F [Planctomycetota bacterium]